jgi:hypothetical protein
VLSVRPTSGRRRALGAGDDIVLELLHPSHESAIEHFILQQLDEFIQSRRTGLGEAVADPVECVQELYLASRIDGVADAEDVTP